MFSTCGSLQRNFKRNILQQLFPLFIQFHTQIRRLPFFKGTKMQMLPRGLQRAPPPLGPQLEKLLGHPPVQNSRYATVTIKAVAQPTPVR